MQFFNVLEKNAAAAATIFSKTYRHRAAAAMSFSKTCCDRAAMDISDSNELFPHRFGKLPIAIGCYHVISSWAKDGYKIF